MYIVLCLCLTAQNLELEIKLTGFKFCYTFLRMQENGDFLPCSALVCYGGIRSKKIEDNII